MNPARSALGYTQITNLSAAVGVGTIPAGTETVVLQAQTQNVRYRDDGTAASATVGMILVALTMYEFTVAQVASMSFFETAASGALNISFYGTRA